jgi:predicted PurR-regulated permease PerM
MKSSLRSLPEGTPDDGLVVDQRWRRASEISTIGIFVIALTWAAYVASPVLLPIIVAWVLATIVLPVVKWLETRGMGRVSSSVLVTVALAVLLVAMLALLSTPITVWIGRASEVRDIIQSKLQGISEPFSAIEAIRKALQSMGGGGTGPVIRVEQQSSAVVTAFTVVTPAVSQFVLCIGALIFYLVFQQRIRSTSVLMLREREARLVMLRTLTEIDEHMTVYFGTFALVNICLGVVTFFLALAVGLPNPLLWAVIACVLNFVPYLGPAVVIAALLMAGLLTFSTFGQALTAPLVFIAIVSVEGQFITPTLMGHQLELNPFAVFLAIAFCTWLWGPVGAFVAVPLLMALTLALSRIVLEEKPDLPG